jgi:nucleoid-associated protein YgaU
MAKEDRWDDRMEDELRKEVMDLRRREAAERKKAKDESRSYVVQPGDSLSKIAKEVYGDANRWREILEANQDQIKDPSMIRPGWELRIP